MRLRKEWRGAAAAVAVGVAVLGAAEVWLLSRDRYAPVCVREEVVWSETAGHGVLRGSCRVRIDGDADAQVFYAIPLGGDRRPGKGAEEMVFYLPRYGERGDLKYDDTPSLRQYVEHDGCSFCSFRIVRSPYRYPDCAALGRCVERLRQWLTERCRLAPDGGCYLIGVGVGADVIAALCTERCGWVRAACVVRRPGESGAGLARWRGAKTDLLVVRQRGGGEGDWHFPPGMTAEFLETEEDLLFSPLEEVAHTFWQWARGHGEREREELRRAEEKFRRRERE